MPEDDVRIVPEESTTIETQEMGAIADTSLTSTVKMFLDWRHTSQGMEPMHERIVMDNASVLERANEQGLTLQQYVQKNPDKAIMEAEASLADWLRIQTSAAIEGQIKTTEGSWIVSKNMTKLIEERTKAAERQRDQIYEYAYTAYQDGERRRDHLIRTAYNRAVNRGDTRMLIYLMDRVDGRPGESKVADLDYDNAYNVYQIIHTLFDKQLEVLNSGSGTKIICCSRRAGKTLLLVAACLIECLRVPNTTCIYIGECWAPDTLLRKYDGTLVRADSVKVGDIMMGAGSEPQKVLALGNGTDQMYRIRSARVNAGIDFTCNSRHILTLMFTRDPLLSHIPKYCQDKYHFEYGKIYDIPLNEYLALPRGARDGLKLYRACIEYQEQAHFIHPYLFGLWLGDGTSSLPEIAVGKQDETVQDHMLQCFAQEMGLVVSKRWQDRGDIGCWVYYFKPEERSNRRDTNPMMAELRRLEVLNNKRIPVSYMFDSIENRLQLLAGLIDSDGHVLEHGQMTFANSDKQLIDDVMQLCQSLGLQVTCTSSIDRRYDSISYNLCIAGQLSDVPTRLDRKQCADSIYCPGYGFTVEPVGEGPYNGFVLDGNGRCLLADYTVTHNTLELTEGLINQAANQIIDQCKLRDRRGKRLNWRRFDNGSSILVRGLSNTKDPDLIRGHKAKVIVVDEFFHLKGELLNYLIQEVLQPMQLDYAADYKFLCAGTPPPIKGTYGEHAWKTWEVPHFTWTYKDNPHPSKLEDREAYVEKVLKEKGLTWESVLARREYGGEWIYDDDLLLYPEFHCYNPREAYPSFNIDQVLFGIDYGVGDHDTLIGIAWDSTERRGYVFHEDKFNRLDIKDRTVSQLQFLESRIISAWEEALAFFPSLSPKEANKRILWDADDNEQRVTDHFNLNLRLKQYPELRLNIVNAHKTQKVQMFDKIRDLLRTAHLLFIEGGVCANEATKTVLKRGPNGQVYPEVDMKTFHPDALPALRYALWNVIGREAAPKE